MKWLKILGLAAVAALALTAFAGPTSASATVLCKTNPTYVLLKGYTCPILWVWGQGTPNKAQLAAGKKVLLKNTTGEPLVECSTSTIGGETENKGSETETVHGKIATLDFGECNHTVDTLVNGELEIHGISSEGANGNGTVTAKGSEVTASILGVSCTYGAGSGVDIGTLVGGKPATISVNAVLNKTAGSFLCPGDARWEASYEMTAPDPVWTSDYAD